MTLAQRLVAAANGDVEWRKSLLLEAAAVAQYCGVCTGCGGTGMFHNHKCPELAEGLRIAASGAEARRAETLQDGSVHDGPTTEGGDAQ